LLVVNCLGVFVSHRNLGAPIQLPASSDTRWYWYGNVEAVMGVLKITLVIGSFLAMCILNNQGDDTNASFYPSANFSLMIDTHASTQNGKSVVFVRTYFLLASKLLPIAVPRHQWWV